MNPGGDDGAGDGGAGDDRQAFERAMREVEPLAGGGDRVALRRRPAPRPAPRRPQPQRFQVERWGERVEGLAAGGDRRRLRALARGEIEIEARLDLHGLGAEAARETLHAALARLAVEGRRCLLVIHGRGLSSPDAPVLKEAVPGWLTEPPAAARVRAFATAPPAHGGPGATLVLLRPAVRRKS